MFELVGAFSDSSRRRSSNSSGTGSVRSRRTARWVSIASSSGIPSAARASVTSGVSAVSVVSVGASVMTATVARRGARCPGQDRSREWY